MQSRFKRNHSSMVNRSYSRVIQKWDWALGGDNLEDESDEQEEKLRETVELADRYFEAPK